MEDLLKAVVKRIPPYVVEIFLFVFVHWIMDIKFIDLDRYYLHENHDLDFDFARPAADPLKPLRALVYDCWYDRFKGIICNIAVKDGVVSKGKMV